MIYCSEDYCSYFCGNYRLLVYGIISSYDDGLCRLQIEGYNSGILAIMFGLCETIVIRTNDKIIVDVGNEKSFYEIKE